MTRNTGGGVGGSLRLVGLFAVLCLAALATLFVFDAIPREELADTAVKVFALLGIAAVTVVAAAALLGGRRE